MSDLPTGIPRGYFSGSNGGKLMTPKTKLKTSHAPLTEVDDDAVAERIKQALESTELTRGQIASAMGISEKVIHSWARLGQISKHKLPAFCDLVNVSEGWLLTGRGVSMYQQMEHQESHVVEFRRPLSADIHPKAEFTVRNCPIADTVFLGKNLPEESIRESKLQYDILHGLFENPDEWTSLPVPILDKDMEGLPTFAIQILTREHEPNIKLGALIAFSTDLLPERGDFCIMARRPKGGVWSMSAGYFQMNQRVIVIDHAEFYEEAGHKRDMGITMSLTRLPDTPSQDPFIIDCFNDEWLLIGVGVYGVAWLNPAHRATQTRLEERIQRRFKGRGRPQ